MSDVIRHIIVRGKVQGVGYRAWIEGEAVARGSPDGRATARTARWKRCFPAPNPTLRR